MGTELESSCRELLAMIPGCAERSAELGRAAEYFGLSQAEIERAARLLPEHFELGYEGVRSLLAEYVHEALDAFAEPSGIYCELSVPAPPVQAMALGLAAGERVRFGTRALALQVLLRGQLLSRKPLSFDGCSKRRCGLNLMRRRLVLEPPVKAPDCVLQYGLLCDECTKTCEGLGGGTKVLSMTVQKGAARAGRERFRSLSAGFEHFAREAAGMLDMPAPDAGQIREAARMSAEQLGALTRLTELNARPGRRPLRGTSLALAQTTQLMCFSRPERVTEALRTLCRELEAAPESEPGRTRLYCFYPPLTLPELDLGFWSNGVDLLGSAAFLYSAGSLGTGLGGLSASWLDAMTLAGPTSGLCGAIARAAERSGCAAYLSGGFSFDRWMGSATPLQRRILEHDYGLKTLDLDYDFWCENQSSAWAAERVDSLCVQLHR